MYQGSSQVYTTPFPPIESLITFAPPGVPTYFSIRPSVVYRTVVKLGQQRSDRAPTAKDWKFPHHSPYLGTALIRSSGVRPLISGTISPLRHPWISLVFQLVTRRIRGVSWLSSGRLPSESLPSSPELWNMPASRNSVHVYATATDCSLNSSSYSRFQTPHPSSHVHRQTEFRARPSNGSVYPHGPVILLPKSTPTFLTAIIN